MKSRRVGYRGLAIFVVLLTACSDPSDPVQPIAQVEMIAGTLQSGGYGLSLAEPLVIRVTVNGAAAAGMPVTWRVLEGGGHFERQDSVTDENGLAEAVYVLGSIARQQLVYAEAGGSGVTFLVAGLELIRDVYAGRDHSCSLASDGRAYCWGANDWGQLGTGDFTASHIPRPVQGGLRFSKLAPGPSHTCGLSAGEIWCWGSNSLGQLGNGTTSLAAVPTRVSSEGTFTDVSVGATHSCAVEVSAGAMCWGDDTRGQVGGHDTTCPAPGIGDVPCRLVPAPVADGSEHVQLDAGELHTCAIDRDGVLSCWGANDWGELGRGVFGGHDAVPAAVDGGAPSWRAVSAGSRHTCAIGTDGTTWCWGWNASGALGASLPVSENRAQPIQVSGSHAFAQIESGLAGTCGRTLEGAAWCWGELRGDGVSGSTPEPVLVETAGTVLAIARGDRHACAVLEETAGPAVWCWGANPRGQVGIPRHRGAFLLEPVAAAVPSERF